MFFIFIACLLVFLVSFIDKQKTQGFFVFALVYTITNAKKTKRHNVFVFVYVLSKNKIIVIFCFWALVIV